MAHKLLYIKYLNIYISQENPMLNLTIPPQVNTSPSDSTMPANNDISTNNLHENGQFNKILAKEISDKSANKATPTEESSAEQSNVKAPPQTPESSSQLTQYNIPKKTFHLSQNLN